MNSSVDQGRLTLILCRPVFLFLLCVSSSALGQDKRVVTEPRIPPVSETLNAALSARGGTLSEADEARVDTLRLQRAIDQCASGSAVQLRADGKRNAFLTGPIELRPGVALIVD